MARKLADVFVHLATDDSKLKSGIASAEQKTSSFAGKAAGLLGGVLVAGAAAAGAAVIGVGKAALSAEGEYKAAMDAIINATGASGDQLDAMGESVKNLKSSAAGLDVTMEDIGAALGEVNTRTGLTGDELEDLTGEILNFSRLTGTDAVNATALLTRTMGDWGVENENAAELLDSIYGAGQAFGISVDSLAGKLVQFGAPLRQMGFDLDESIAMLGKWEQEGVNTELVIGSLRIAAGNFARDNIPLRDGLNETMEAIKGAASESEGLAIAMDVFGARAGPDMAAAIREGRFELDEAITALQGTKGGLDDAAERTIGFREQWKIATADIGVELIPLGQALAGLAEKLLPHVVTAISAVIEVVTPWVRAITTAIDWIGSLGEKLASGEGHIGAFGDKYAFVGERLEGIMESLRQITDRVLSAIAQFWEQHGEKILRIVTNGLRGIETVFRTVLEVVLGMVQFWLQVLTGDFEGASQTLISVVLAMWDGISEIFRLALDNLRTIFGEIDWGELGRNIIDGIANGIRNAGGFLADAARDAAQRAYDAARAMLRINSPSEKAAEGIGKPFVQGIEEGIRTSLGELQYGLDLGLGGLFNSLQPATATAGMPISIVVNVNGDSGTGQAARSGVLSALRQAGLA